MLSLSLAAAQSAFFDRASASATPAQVALAWLLAQGDDIAPIPGTKHVSRVEENTAADGIELSTEQLQRLNDLTPATGERHDETGMAAIDRWGGSIDHLSTARERRMAGEQFRQALDDSREIELTVTGRTSGRKISNPVWFVRDGEKLYLVPVKGSDSDWYKNVLKTPTILLAAGAAQFKATGNPSSDTAKVEQILDMFRAKYGARDVEAYYPKQDVAVEVPLI